MRGSSPLARGKLCGRVGGNHLTRLIPARAGKTSLILTITAMIAAHPRSRGENPTTG